MVIARFFHKQLTMQKHIALICTYFFISFTYAQQRVELVTSGIADVEIVVVNSGISDYTVRFVDNGSIADLSVGITTFRSRADYIVSDAFEEQTIEVKSSGFGDYKFELVNSGISDVTLCIDCDASPDVWIYLDDRTALLEREIVALLYKDIIKKAEE